ncbi:unnamed protein product [Penicillium manginii]
MSDRSSADKKRDRDRRAQQNLRDKKLRHTAKLEARVAHCEQHHNDAGVKNLLGVIDGLRKQNELLVAQQRALRTVLNSWDEKFEEMGPSSSPMTVTQDTNTEKTAHSFPQANYTPAVPNYLDTTEHLACSMGPSTSPPSLPQTPASHRINPTSPWNELPLCSDGLSNIEKSSLPWLAYPDLIAQCPDTPESPLDILYGSKTNMLANMIHTIIERRPVRDPERLAMGLLIYHFSKWIIEPNPKTFAKLPPFIRPLQEQFEIEHPISISFLPYPKLRSNLIQQWPLYENNRDELFGLLACSVKIRWPWGVKILDRDEDNEIRIKPAFYETIMKEEGWGLMQEFINKYPNLMF